MLLIIWCQQHGAALAVKSVSRRQLPKAVALLLWSGSLPDLDTYEVSAWNGWSWYSFS